MLLCNRKTTHMNHPSPAGGCTFHLIPYFLLTTNLTYGHVFRTYFLHKMVITYVYYSLCSVCSEINIR